MSTEPQRQKRNKAKAKKHPPIKKSLSLTPKAWECVKKHANKEAKKHGNQVNLSAAASNLVVEGSDAMERREHVHITT